MASSEEPTTVYPSASAPTEPPPTGPGLTPHEPSPGGPGGPADPPLPPTGPPGGGGDGSWDDGGPGGPDDPAKRRNVILGVIAGALILIALFLGLSVLGGDDNDDEQAAKESTPAAVATTTPPSTPTATPAESTPPAADTGDSTDAETDDGNSDVGTGGGVAVGEGGDAEPADEGPLLEAGAVTKIKVNKGDDVIFRVLSETDEEVHVHGYDESFDVRAGKEKTISFPATIEGIFEIEFENSSTQIGELTVEP